MRGYENINFIRGFEARSESRACLVYLDLYRGVSYTSTLPEKSGGRCPDMCYTSKIMKLTGLIDEHVDSVDSRFEVPGAIIDGESLSRHNLEIIHLGDLSLPS